MKKEGEEIIKPIIVEFHSEYNKWTVLRRKSVLRDMNDYNVFLEQDLSREERDNMIEIIQERKPEWVLRGKTIERQINGENGVEECKEVSYERETDGIERLDAEELL